MSDSAESPSKDNSDQVAEAPAPAESAKPEAPQNGASEAAPEAAPAPAPVTAKDPAPEVAPAPVPATASVPAPASVPEAAAVPASEVAEAEESKIRTESTKRGREDEANAVKEKNTTDAPPDNAKKLKTDTVAAGADGEKSEPAPIPASKEGISIFNDNDVLSGRGGGTNVHPGNRNFRDLINLHRRAYLKARKNDKPAISRAIVRSVRENGGRFLKKDEKSGLWFEVGDDAAREKTSQALRQRAPEMRKLLFDTEREEARVAAEEHLRQQRVMMGMPPDAPMAGMMPMQMVPPGANPMAFNPALFAGRPGMPPNGQETYQQMFQAAMMQNNMNRPFAPPTQQNGNSGNNNS